MYDIHKLRRKSEPVQDYMVGSYEAAPKFIENYNSYVLDLKVAEKLEKFVKDVIIFVFSAEWCSDCIRNIPILAHLNNKIGLEVNVFGHIMKDAKGNKERWRIPPSPEEVKDFDVIKIPLVVVLNEKGELLGKIVENPPKGKSLEEAILDILT
jgi:thiol-disulfide isomerase/thioredoxin